ncbi:hypothetical protein MMC14_008016 [Varicellaria rhodocarpa]|nr:hypothetical protein [Varicellaria rhodocarpa]
MDVSVSRGAFQASIVNLESGSIAEVWDNNYNPHGGCFWHTLETYRGGPPRISGMSYDQSPVEPIVTGTGALLAGLCNTLKYGIPLPKKWRRRGGGDGLGAGPGAGVKAQEPNWAYPDVIVVGKTNYTDERRGDLMYRDEVGNVLNLTRLQSSK